MARDVLGDELRTCSLEWADLADLRAHAVTAFLAR